MSLSVYHLMPPQLGLILLGLNFESASCCHIRVVRGEAKNQEAADSQGVRQNRGTSNFGALKLRRTEPGINQLCCPIVEEVQGVDRICKSRPSWDGRRSVLATAGGGGRYRQHHHSQVHDLLSAYFWEKVQARCSPSQCRLCPRSSLTRRNLSSLPPLQPDQLTQAPPAAAAAAAVGHQTLLLQIPPRPSCSRMPTGCVALVAAIYYHQQQHMADELQS